MTKETKEFVKKLRELYKEELSKKPAWGKNEAINMFDKIFADLVIEFMDRG